MRIAWVVYGPLAQTTGGYIYDRLVVERLQRGGSDVRIVSLAPRGLRGVLRGPALARTLATLACDVVVGDELCFPELSSAFPRLAGRVARVLLVHHLSSWERPAVDARATAVARIERAAIRASERCIATSPTTAARLLREHGAHADVAAPGADRLRATPRARGAGDDALDLLFVGTLTPRKGVLTLLDAVDRARASLAASAAPRLRLTLIGDDARDAAYAAEVRARIARSPWLLSTVTIAGVVADDALAARLANADALVLPSRFEGYGMVLTEALAQGTPVIATRAGAIADVVRDGAEALLVPPDDADALADALVHYATNAERRRHMRSCAETRRGSLTTWDATAQRVGDVLAAATAARPRSEG